jgi:DNA-binding MarR family transcriptional regulator
MDRRRIQERGSIVRLLAVLGAAARRRAGATVLGLAERCGLGGSTAVGVVDRLEETGLVRRERDREDRRVVHVLLTPRGREAAEALPALAAGLEEELTEGFSPAEREALRDHLVRLAETFRARSPELLEKLRAERLKEWTRAKARRAGPISGRGKGRPR